MNEKKKTLAIVIALVVVIAVIGGTYAWLTLTKNAENVNIIKTGTLELAFENESEGISISGDEAQPISLTEVKDLDGYNFTLRNTGDIAVKYIIYLDDATEAPIGENGSMVPVSNRMPDKYIRYAINYVPGVNEQTQLLSSAGIHPNRKIVDEEVLGASATKNFNLKLWIDSEADNDVMGTTFAGKIRVEATQQKATSSVQPDAGE